MGCTSTKQKVSTIPEKGCKMVVLTITFDGNKLIQISAADDFTIATLKEFLRQYTELRTGIKPIPTDIVMLHKKKELQNDKTLAQLKIHKKTTLDLHVPGYTMICM